MMPAAFVLVAVLMSGPMSPAYFATSIACGEAKAWIIRNHGQAECFPTGAATISHIEE
jgi:hypothetical protein